MRKLNVMDGQTDRRQYLPSRAFGATGDNKAHKKAPVWLINNQTGPILLIPAIPSPIDINLHIKYGSNPDFVSYRIQKEMSADEAAA